MAHGGRPLPSNPALARPPILWAEDFVAIAGSLPLMDPQGGLKPLPESGPYEQPVSFQGATALHLAAFYGHLGVTDLLLAAGACDVTARNIQVHPISHLTLQHDLCRPSDVSGLLSMHVTLRISPFVSCTTCLCQPHLFLDFTACRTECD